MEFEIREKNSYTREISVTVPWTNLINDYERTISLFRRKIHLPGFRKGKVPRKILFQKFGLEIEADFTQTVVQEYYRKALKENNISPISQAKMEHISFTTGKPLEFKATFEVEPDVELINYQKKFNVKKNIYIADDEDVDQYIEEFRRQFAELRTVETGSEQGHLLLVDMQELDRTGIPMIGRKVEDRYIKVGDGIFGGENLSRLTGLKPGDEVIIEAYTKADNSSQKYGLKVKNVQEEILPELNEEFIKKVDKSATDEAELRKNVLQRIEGRLERDSEIQLKESMIDYFIQNTNIEVPASMVENYIEKTLEEARRDRGDTLDEKGFKEEIRPSAIRNLKWYLIRKALIKSEQLAVSDDEVEKRINQIVDDSGKEGSNVRRFYRKPSHREHLRDDLLDQKLFEHLELFAKIDNVKIYTKDLRKQ